MMMSKWRPSGPELEQSDRVHGGRPIAPMGRRSPTECSFTIYLGSYPHRGERGGKERRRYAPPNGPRGVAEVGRKRVHVIVKGCRDRYLTTRDTNPQNRYSKGGLPGSPFLVLKRGLWRLRSRAFTMRLQSPWGRRLGEK
jgi:hypothetical protein